MENTYTNDFNVIDLELQIEDDSIKRDGDYHTGYFDGLTEGEPNEDDWTNSLSYQNGYLTGIKDRYDNQFIKGVLEQAS